MSHSTGGASGRGTKTPNQAMPRPAAAILVPERSLCLGGPAAAQRQRSATIWRLRMHFLRYLALGFVAAALAPGVLVSSPRVEPPPDLLIGYTEFRTDLPGGRYVNVATMRAVVIKADGTGRRVLADELTREKGSWVQSCGWSPDGRTAILLRGWESEENGKWEEQHKTFRYSADGWLYDGYLFELKSNKATNVTGVERVSHYNVGLGYLPGATRLGFLALVDG